MGAPLHIGARGLICDVAWALQMSEEQFFRDFSKDEREQLIATYQSRNHRGFVQDAFPVKEH